MANRSTQMIYYSINDYLWPKALSPFPLQCCEIGKQVNPLLFELATKKSPLNFIVEITILKVEIFRSALVIGIVKMVNHYTITLQSIRSDQSRPTWQTVSQSEHSAPAFCWVVLSLRGQRSSASIERTWRSTPHEIDSINTPFTLRQKH